METNPSHPELPAVSNVHPYGASAAEAIPHRAIGK
jgi:hypothetical protein